MARAVRGFWGASRRSRTALTAMTRLGFAARGLIYGLIGGFALAAVAGGRPHGIADAVAAIDSTPLRVAGSVVLALGLFCFAGHLTVNGIRDWMTRRGPRHWLFAAGMFGDAAIYLGFIFSVLNAAIGGGQGGERQTQGWTALLMQQPAGRILVGLIGLSIVGCGVGMVGWAAIADLERDLKLPRYEKSVFQPLTRVGFGGRGLAIGLVGVYWLLAAINGDPSQAHMLGGALASLRRHAFGEGLLVMLGLAFVASAGFDVLEAAFRRREPA